MSTCTEVQDDLSALAAGEAAAIARHADHLASCDTCRDLRHEATQLAAIAGTAGADYVVPTDLAARVLAALGPAAKSTEANPIENRVEIVSLPDKRVATAPGKRTGWVAAGVVLVAGALAAGVAVKMSGTSLVPTKPLATAQGSDEALVAGTRGIATITNISRASQTPTGGISVKTTGAWRVLAKDEGIPTGATIKTDERTRISLLLADGSTLVLDHDTELAFAVAEVRTMALARGRMVADVVHIAARPASIATPSGLVAILGTKLVVTTAPALTSVQVVRGEVAMTAAFGAKANVRAGEEGVIDNATLEVASAPSLANELGWSELGTPVHADTDELTSGLGSLRAYKPGEKRDRDWNLVLAKHDVKVRINGPIARTEITETFRNDSDATLEGVYQFPLPADAQIDGLALDMKDAPGGFIEGAFVDKRRAQKIWQGVIDKAAPVLVERPKNEIIWVPGRWRDPALLDWQRGGRFQLKVYPIPNKGVRTIKIAYTQVVGARGAYRQYVYPLAHSTDGSTVADTMSLDVEVRGAARGGVRSRNYQLTPDAARADVNAMTMTASAFVPRGDLVIDYRAADGDAELRAWTYAGGAAVAPDEQLALKKGVGIDPVVVAAQRAVAADLRPTAVLALRPRLPRSRESVPRDIMIVVDSSQSMVGERYTRATQLALEMIAQMDRRDRFSISACDSECRTLGDLRAPTNVSERVAKTFLSEQVPAGSSDLVASIRKAADFATEAGRQRWVLFVGDGFASTGFRRAADVERALTSVAAKGVQVSTVGIGGDADMALLAAAARGGGGSYLAWTPGQTTQTAALLALESTNGSQLRDATLELPAGLADVAPQVLPTLHSGEEVLLAARVTGEIDGKVVLKGKVGNEPFTQEYPLHLVVKTTAGNGFVPRLWASLAIDQNERRGDGADRLQTIALSQAYGVMSRETSLLVLESDAMFDAFGVDRTQPAQKWSGEDAIDEVVVSGSLSSDPAQIAAGPAAADKTAERSAAPSSVVTTTPPAPPMKREAVHQRPRPTQSLDARLTDDATSLGMGSGRRSDSVSPDMIAMRRTWVRVPNVMPYVGVAAPIQTAVAAAEAALVEHPDSREKHRALVQALAYAGDLDRARDVAGKWLERDKLDPAALGYQADLLGRDGQRELALRTLSGLVDLDADRIALHERMIKAYETGNRLAQACSHRIALAAIQPKNTMYAGAALRCLRSIGRASDAELVRRALPDDATRAAAEKAATVNPIERKLAGDLVVNARWTGGVDLDLSLVTPSGERVSWMGGRKDVVVGDATALDKEVLALAQLKRGNYLLEITRGGTSSGPVRGTLDISVLGTKRSLPFELDGSHVTVSRIAVALEERLEQVTNTGMVPVPMRDVALSVGSSGNEVVNRVVRTRVGMLRACYTQELARDPRLPTSFELSFSVDGTGRVRAANLTQTSSQGLVSCFASTTMRLRFPTTASGTYAMPIAVRRN